MKKHSPRIENGMDTLTFFDLSPTIDPLSEDERSKSTEHTERFTSCFQENENAQKSAKTKEN